MQSETKALMGILPILLLALFVVTPIGRAATTANVYVAQAAAGAGDASACANAAAVSSLGSGSWSAGVTYHLCGNITSAITVGGNGTSGNPVTLQWETGAVLSVCNSSGALLIPGRSYVVVDFGGNAPAITCPDNGSALSTQAQAVAISNSGSAWNHVEIRHGQIGPMFVYSGTANSGFSSACVYANGSNNTYIHNVAITGCASGLDIDPNSTSTDEFSYITSDASVGRLLNYATNGSAIASNSSFHDNDINFSSVWSVPGDYMHYEALHIFPTGTGSDKIINLQIYNNYFHGVSPLQTNGSTALIFVGTGIGESSSSTSEVKMFNNLIVDSGGSNTGFSAGGGLGGYFYSQDSHHTLSIYNNTVVATNGASNSCASAVNTSSTGNVWKFSNNICIGTRWAIRFDNSSSDVFTGSGNIYYNIGSGKWYYGSNYSTLAAWQSATGQDSGSSTSSPGLNSDYTIAGTSSLAHTLAGLNLTSLGVTALDSGKPALVGEGATSSVGVVRPTSAAWDLGAYPMSSSSAGTVNPPSGLTATVQ